MKHFFTAVFFTPLFLALSGCEAASPGILKAFSGGRTETPEVFSAAVWNVQALFDGRETGTEYGQYRESSGWTKEKYAARVNAISAAVPAMLSAGKKEAGNPGPKPAVPDLIGFVEIEHEGILKDLAAGSLSKYGYRFTGFTKLSGSSLGIGFLSRFPFTVLKAHSTGAGNESAPRPVLEARLEAGSEPLVFLLCHWKSKLGGEATEALRRSSAAVIQRRLRELKKSEPETPVIVMGDLNENHDEFSRRGGKTVTALLPDEPLAAAASGTENNYLVLSGEKPPAARSFPDGVPALYSPWQAGIPGASYFYRDDWETIDHVLLGEALFNGSGWEYGDCLALDRPPFTAGNGKPDTYVPRNGRGLSDHLPLLLYLKHAAAP